MTNTKAVMIEKILMQDARRRINIPKYQKPNILDKFGGVCAYCGTVLNGSKKNAWGVTHAIPVHLGGELSADNRIPSCIPCIQKFGSADCLSALTINSQALTPTWSDKLRSIRFDASLRSMNHLTPLSPRSDLKLVSAHVEKRWLQERTTAFLTVLPTHAVVGLTNRSGSSERVSSMAALVNFGFSAERLDTHGDHHSHAQKAGLHLFVVERSRLADLAMALIEENCLLREIRVEITPSHEDPQDWRSYWPRSYPTLKDNQRRKTYGEMQAPWAVKQTLSKTAGAVRARRHYARKQEERLERMQRHAHVSDLRVVAGQPADWDMRCKQLEEMLALQLKLS